MLGLLPHDSGEIFSNGTKVADPSIFLVPPRCAYTPQVPRLFSDTLLDNILMGQSEQYVSVSGAIKLAVMERDLATLENGLATLVGPRGVKLGGADAAHGGSANASA